MFSFVSPLFRVWIPFSFLWHTRPVPSVFRTVGYVVSAYAYAFYSSNRVILEKTMLTDGNGVFSDFILFSFGTLVPLLLLRELLVQC